MSSEDTECPHGLDARWCATCLHGPRQRENWIAAIGYTFEAKLDGQCPACDLPVMVGQRIVKVTRVGGGETYEHVECVR